MISLIMVNARPWLGYKYIPSLDGPHDADYPTVTINETKIDELWFAGTGEIYFGDGDISDIGYSKPVIDTLKTLPILTLKQALRFRGSAVLRYDLSHRLK